MTPPTFSDGTSVRLGVAAIPKTPKPRPQVIGRGHPCILGMDPAEPGGDRTVRLRSAQPALDEIADAVERVGGVPMVVICQGERRSRLISTARGLYCYAAHEYTRASYPRIAAYLQLRQSSVVDAAKRFAARAAAGDYVITVNQELSVRDLLHRLLDMLDWPLPVRFKPAHAHQGGSLPMSNRPPTHSTNAHRQALVAQREKALRVTSDVEHAITVLRHKAVAGRLTLRAIDAARDGINEAAAELDILREGVS